MSRKTYILFNGEKRISEITLPEGQFLIEKLTADEFVSESVEEAPSKRLRVPRTVISFHKTVKGKPGLPYFIWETLKAVAPAMMRMEQIWERYEEAHGEYPTSDQRYIGEISIKRLARGGIIQSPEGLWYYDESKDLQGKPIEEVRE